MAGAAADLGAALGAAGARELGARELGEASDDTLSRSTGYQVTELSSEPP